MKIQLNCKRNSSGCVWIVILLLLVLIGGILVWILGEWIEGLTPRPESNEGNPAELQPAPAAAQVRERMMNGIGERSWFGMEFAIAPDASSVTVTKVFIPEAMSRTEFNSNTLARTGVDLSALEENAQTNNSVTFQFDANGNPVVLNGTVTVCVERKGTLENLYEGTGDVSAEDAELMEWEIVQLMTLQAGTTHRFIDTTGYDQRAFYRVRLIP